MADKTSTRVKKAGGVRFTTDPADSLNKHDDNPTKTTELLWEQCCDHECSFDLRFGILKLSHSYTMTMTVVFHQTPLKLETVIDDHEHNDGLQLLVTEVPQSHIDNRTSFEVEVVIHSRTIPGPFHRTFLLKDTSRPEREGVRVNVSGSILRQGQGTATLKHGVHMKSIMTAEKDDDDE